MDVVRDLGVDFAQGYHLGKPEPVSALRDQPD
jgi:EAL domain-containing protein (putative c-di-GMP-specific phosphodiesterase class I)